ncbi:MAG: hypothetical protein AAFR18_20200 [Cyanobacteria bacterium J06627_32]
MFASFYAFQGYSEVESTSISISLLMHPPYWSQFLTAHQLVHTEVSIPEEVDLSELGIDLKFYDAGESRVEMEKFYPGLVVGADGFVAVACCTTGSGDPYFINIHDGADGPLYRIYHDEVALDSYDRTRAVTIVLSNYTDVLEFV